jgi:YHS domain-containing protein
MRKTILIVFIILLPGFLAVAGGKTEDSGQGIFVDSNGIAAKGADVVAYYGLKAGDGAVMGSPDFTYEWKGATWQFANSENLETFKADPEKYAPKYGGYCAYAIGIDKLYGIDPNSWTVHDGRLYLNADSGTQKKWLAKRDEYIESGDRNWPKHREKLLQAAR